MTDLSQHQPSEAAKRRAEAANVDLERLRYDDPNSYKMLNASYLLTVTQRLKDELGQLIFQSFPEVDLYDAPLDSIRVQLLAFPALDRGALEALDVVLSRWAEADDRPIYYRQISTLKGDFRDLGLPLAPADWSGQQNVLIGGFASEAEAKRWQDATFAPYPNLMADRLLFEGQWYVDAFFADI